MSAQDVAVSTPATNEQDPARTKVIASLYELALLLERHPEMPVPYQLSDTEISRLTIGFYEKDAKERLNAAARAIPGPGTKRVYGPDTMAYFALDKKVGSITISLSAFRDAVCERVVTGTREVTEEVPDPEKLAEVPVVTVTRTVEDVVWECGPLLREQVTR